MMKHGLLLLKEKWTAQSTVVKLPLLDTIHDPLLRDALHREYENVTQQARNTMMAMYMECAEKQQRQYRTDFDATMKEMLNDREHSRQMHNLVHKHIENISTSIDCEYKYQLTLVRLKN